MALSSFATLVAILLPTSILWNVIVPASAYVFSDIVLHSRC